MLAFIVFTAAIAVATPEPGEVKVFGDWTVGCDNTRSCEAVTLIPDGADHSDRIAISIRRRGEAGHAGWITVHPAAHSDIRIIDRTRLRVDDRSLDVPVRVSGGGMWVEAQHIPRLIIRLRRGEMLQVAEASGRIYGGASLTGLVEALRHIDQVQGRTGTVTAWIARGNRPADTIPAPPTRPVIEAPARSDVPPRTLDAAETRRVSRPEPCRREPAREPVPTYARLDAATTLALVPWGCAVGLSYNTTEYAVVIDENGAVSPARFDVTLAGADAPPNELTSSYWDPSHGLLRIGIRGRGLGDCGTLQSYAWDGTMFRLVSQSDMPVCRGSARFIPTWQAERVWR